MKKRGREKDPADMAWNSFVRTGDITYYVLYKKLSGKD